MMPLPLGAATPAPLPQCAAPQGVRSRGGRRHNWGAVVPVARELYSQGDLPRQGITFRLLHVHGEMVEICRLFNLNQCVGACGGVHGCALCGGSHHIALCSTVAPRLPSLEEQGDGEDLS